MLTGGSLRQRLSCWVFLWHYDGYIIIIPIYRKVKKIVKLESSKAKIEAEESMTWCPCALAHLAATGQLWKGRGDP